VRKKILKSTTTSTIAMPLIGNHYLTDGDNPVWINNLEARDPPTDRPGVGFLDITLADIVERVRSERGDRDALERATSSDALFGFAIRAIEDDRGRPGRLGEDRVWRRLLEMGLAADGMSGDVRESIATRQAVRYTAVIANELMRRQEGLENRVCRRDWSRPSIVLTLGW
jgi:hypothetical protein